MGVASFDELYVHRLAEGHPETERHFTSYFGNLLLIKLRSRLRSRQHIDDLRQETLVRVIAALRRKGGITQPDRLGAYVNAVCNNVLLEHFRGQAHLAPMPEDAPEPPSNDPDAESELVSWERRGVVHKVLAEMQDKDRRVLEMLFIEEADKDEVCRQLSIDRDYLRVLLHRAKLRFREILARHGAAGPLGSAGGECLSQGG